MTHSFGVNPGTQDHEIWPEETKNTALLYGIHIVTDNYLVLSQFTRLTERWTDGQTSIARPCVCTCSRTAKTDLQHNCAKRCIFVSKYTRNYLPIRICLDPLGELTVLRQTIQWIYGVGTSIHHGQDGKGERKG